MNDKKEIQKKQIQMTWDYLTKDADIHSRKVLQYFAILLTFILGLILAVVTNNCDFWVAAPIVTALLILSYLSIRKIRSYSKKLRTALDELLDELDKLK